MFTAFIKVNFYYFFFLLLLLLLVVVVFSSSAVGLDFGLRFALTAMFSEKSPLTVIINRRRKWNKNLDCRTFVVTKKEQQQETRDLVKDRRHPTLWLIIKVSSYFVVIVPRTYHRMLETWVIMAHRWRISQTHASYRCVYFLSRAPPSDLLLLFFALHSSV